MKNPNPHMLLRIAQGDAFAAAAEFIGDKEHLYKFDKYYQHPGHENLKPGSYTDDTQMSIANAEVLLKVMRDNDDVVTGPLDLSFSRAWIRAFKRDERDGYARGFQKFLESIKLTKETIHEDLAIAKAGDEFKSRIKPTSDRNGAAMRAVPLGVIPNISNLLAVSDIQAKLTHNTFGGVLSSRVVALASHYALYTDEPLRYVDRFVEEHFGRNMSISDDEAAWLFEDWMGAVPCHGIKTARAVLSLLRNYDNLMDMMRQTILWGGDTDSVGAIAWGIASTRYNDKLPEFFEKDLEVGGEYGVDFLLDLGEKLMRSYE
jgi:ADP-ribosylglycohydrolase